MEPFRPTYAEIDLKKLRKNIQRIKKIISPKTKFMAIVKANAYGHGAVEVAKTAESAGVDFLGVATLGEALELRSAFIKSPILVLSETAHEHVQRLIDADITQTVYSFELAQLLSDTAKQKNAAAKIHIKVDTGMGRVGVLAENAPALIKKIASLPNLNIDGIFTHFSKADSTKSDFTKKQFNKFMSVIKQVEAMGIRIPIKHAANSAATLYFPETQLDMVRIGICMYGLYPAKNIRKNIGIEPVLSFKTKVIYVKEVPKGTPISYGATYTTPSKKSIATLPVGYADGLPRGLSNKGHVLIKGKRFPIIGNVTMDMTLVDTSRDKIEVGDDVVIIGCQGKQQITSDEIAEQNKTINYEIICGIGKRVPRVYIS